MKKIIIIAIAMLFGYSAYAQDPYTGAQKPKDVSVSTKVITPFKIWDYTPGQGINVGIQEVIKGTKRIISPSEGAILFEMLKESYYTVRLNLSIASQTVGYVTIKANWYFNDTPPNWSKDFPGVPLNSAWDWYDQQNHGWITIMISEIDAMNPNVTLGTKTFTANVNGYYIGL